MKNKNDYEEYEDYEDYDEDYLEEDIDYLEDDPETQQMLHVGRLRVAAGVADFFSVIAGMLVVLILIALLVSLINWLVSDVGQMFALLQRRIK